MSGPTKYSNIGFYLIFGFCTFFIWSDLSFFGELAERGYSVNGTNIMTVKLRMQDHIAHYVYLPFCKWLNENFGISSIPGVTPNLITGMHFCLAILAGRFFSHSSLFWRRFAVLIYEIRGCLDILDGVVYRAQNHKVAFVSGWGTYGYLMDASADTMGGLLLALGTWLYLHRNPPFKTPKDLKNKGDFENGMKLLPESSSDFEYDPDDHDHPWMKRVSRRTVNVTVTLFVIQVLVRSGLWDHFQHTYNALLEKPIAGIAQAKQAEILNRHSTWFVLWLWKVNSGDAFLHYVLFAIFADKLWIFLRTMIYIGPPMIAVIGLISQLHVIQVRAMLNS